MTILERLFFRRPRILNLLHKMQLVGATSQTNELELGALTRYAKTARTAIETLESVYSLRVARKV